MHFDSLRHYADQSYTNTTTTAAATNTATINVLMPEFIGQLFITSALLKYNI